MKEAFWLIDQLVQQGVEHFCTAPGSRSTPLVLAASRHPRTQVHVHYDERGLGFFALGLSRGSRNPIAVISTSGTAVGNLLPSVMEAHHTCTPLLLLTADRPAELRDVAANQTTDQVKIFSPFVRWQVDLPPQLDEAYFRSIGAQAFFYAKQNPPGPVQINCQCRDPLYVPDVQWKEGTPVHLEFPRYRPDIYKSPFSKGIIAVGPLPHPEDIHPILELAERIQWPVFADLLSNARNFPSREQILYFDWILKRGCHLEPEQILHFGGRLTSKRWLEWIRELKSTHYLHVSPYPFLQDPERRLTARVQADIAEFCPAFRASGEIVEPGETGWMGAWKNLDKEISTIVELMFSESYPLTEAHAMRILARAIPSDLALFFGNGMPIRDANNFLFPQKTKGFFGNRGLSGIDGNIATIAGLATSLRTPIAAVIGDQACLHDLSSLPLLKKAPVPIYLIVSNNYGGGIFSHLPVVEAPEFEKLFAASHAWHFGDAAKMFGLPYARIRSGLEKDLKKIFKTGRTTMIEIATCRSANRHFYQDLTQACAPVQAPQEIEGECSLAYF